MTRMTTFQKLDEVLRCLERHHAEKYFTFIDLSEQLDKDCPYYILFGDIKAILNKLHADGFIDIIESENQKDVYRINFEGKVFNEEGGYVAQNIRLKRLDSIATRQMETGRHVFWLTLLIALGTLVAAVYYSLEIWKFFHPLLIERSFYYQLGF